MKYLTERSLYYYFLMLAVTDAGTEAWSFIAKKFGLKPKELKAYEAVLANPVLDELTTIGDVEMYKNYIAGFFVTEADFGKSKCEKEAIEAKALALHKIEELFGEMQIKGSRLRSLSHNFERDHIACVLYALQVAYLNDCDECRKYAEEMLEKEFEEGENSDAGLILLKLRTSETDEIVSGLKSLPDMLLRPDMLKYLSKQYKGGSGLVLKNKRTIGF